MITVTLHGFEGRSPIEAIKSLRAETFCGLKFAKADCYDVVRGGGEVNIDLQDEDAVRRLIATGWKIRGAEGAVTDLTVRVPTEHVDVLRRIVQALGGVTR